MKDYTNKIITIPNLMSMFRLLLIVPIMITFFNKMYLLSLILIIVSGISDVVDGIIARKFNMVSNLGKFLDPVADKLTQIAIMICIAFVQPFVMIPCGILIVKEIVSGLFGIYVVKHIKRMLWADWHGKAATVSLYTMMAAHMLMLIITGNIVLWVSYVTIGICAVLVTLSFVLYLIRYKKIINLIKEGKGSEVNEENKEIS